MPATKKTRVKNFGVGDFFSLSNNLSELSLKVCAEGIDPEEFFEDSENESPQEAETETLLTLKQCIRGALSTDNNLFLWEIYLLHRQAGQPIPEFVLSYLDECAQNLVNAGYKSIHPAQVFTKNYGIMRADPDRCVNALGLKLKNKRDAFISFQRFKAWYVVIIGITKCKEDYLATGKAEDEAIRLAIRDIHEELEKALGKDAPSLSSVRKNYKEHVKQIADTK